MKRYWAEHLVEEKGNIRKIKSGSRSDILEEEELRAHKKEEKGSSGRTRAGGDGAPLRF